MLLPMNVLLKNHYNSIFHFNEISNFEYFDLKNVWECPMMASWLPGSIISTNFVMVLIRLICNHKNYSTIILIVVILIKIQPVESR